MKYYPTEKMWSDVLTKPLQGEKFRKMRLMRMNCPEDYYEMPSNNLYSGNESTNNHDQQKKKMMTKPTRLAMPSQECVGVK